MPEDLEVLRINIILPETSEDILALAPKEVKTERKENVREWVEKSFRNLEILKFCLGELDLEEFLGEENHSKVLLCVYSKDKIKLSSFMATVGHNANAQPSTVHTFESFEESKEHLKYPGRKDLLAEKYPGRKDLLAEKYPGRKDLLEEKYPGRKDLSEEKDAKNTFINYDMLNLYKPYVVNRNKPSKPVLRGMSNRNFNHEIAASRPLGIKNLHTVEKCDSVSHKPKYLKPSLYSTKYGHPKIIFINKIMNKEGKPYYYEVMRNREGKRQCNVFVKGQTQKQICAQCFNDYFMRKNSTENLSNRPNGDAFGSLNIFDNLSFKCMGDIEYTHRMMEQSLLRNLSNKNTQFCRSVGVLTPSRTDIEEKDVSATLDNTANVEIRSNEKTQEDDGKCSSEKLDLSDLNKSEEGGCIENAEGQRSEETSEGNNLNENNADISKCESKTDNLLSEINNSSAMTKEMTNSGTEETCFKQRSRSSNLKHRNFFWKIFGRNKRTKTKKEEKRSLKRIKVRTEQFISENKITKTLEQFKVDQSVKNLQYLDIGTQSSLEGFLDKKTQVCHHCGMNLKTTTAIDVKPPNEPDKKDTNGQSSILDKPINTPVINQEKTRDFTSSTIAICNKPVNIEKTVKTSCEVNHNDSENNCEPAEEKQVTDVKHATEVLNDNVKVKSRLNTMGKKQLSSVIDIVKTKVQVQGVTPAQPKERNCVAKPHDFYNKQVLRDVLRYDRDLMPFNTIKTDWIKISSDLEVKQIIKNSSNDDFKSNNIILRRIGKTMSSLSISLDFKSLKNIIKGRKRKNSKILDKPFKDNRKIGKKFVNLSRDRAKLSLVERKMRAARPKLDCRMKRIRKESALKNMNNVKDMYTQEHTNQAGTSADKKPRRYELFQTANDDFTFGNIHSEFNKAINYYLLNRQHKRKNQENNLRATSSSESSLETS